VVADPSCLYHFLLWGYFIYSSLFAAMGSAINEDMGRPAIHDADCHRRIMCFLYVIPQLSNPNGSPAVFASLFPLFSPIIMPACLAFDPPWWRSYYQSSSCYARFGFLSG
jgi:ABC-2 type transport system permease protein